MSLASARKKAGLTQTDVAEKLQVSRQTVSFWETGLFFPRTALLPVLSEMYGCSIDEFFKRDGDSHEADT